MGRGRERGLQHLLSAGRATQAARRPCDRSGTRRRRPGETPGLASIFCWAGVGPDNIQNPASGFGGGGGGIGAGVEGSSGSRLYHLRLCGTQS